MKDTEHFEELQRILAHFWPRLPRALRERASSLTTANSNKEVSDALFEIHDALDGNAGEGALAAIFQHATWAKEAA